MDLEAARNFLIALLIGALVGIEREKKKGEQPHSLGGIRTYILFALVGAASAWLSREFAAPWAFLVTLAAVGASVVASYVLQNRAGDETALGLTSEVAALAVCLLGAMAVMGSAGLAVALGVVTSAVLAYKQPLHGLVQRIGEDDLYAAIKLLIASFIVLPLLPDEAVDPWQAINPYKLWLLVILISGLSLVGYVAVRAFGASRGTAATGLAGGMVSSTATTLSFVRSARSGGERVDEHALAAGILLAWSMMVVRVAVLLGIVNAPLLLRTAWPLLAMGAVTAALALRHYRAGLAGSAVGPRGMPVGNPFSLTAAIRFGAMFAVVLLVVKLAQSYAPGLGVYVVSALAGTVDVDPVVLSMANERHGAEALAQGALAIVAAMLANTVVRGALVVVLGSGPVRRHVALAAAAIIAAGALAAALG